MNAILAFKAPIVHLSEKPSSPTRRIWAVEHVESRSGTTDLLVHSLAEVCTFDKN